jgi:hypothetical protein
MKKNSIIWLLFTFGCALGCLAQNSSPTPSSTAGVAEAPSATPQNISSPLSSPEPSAR